MQCENRRGQRGDVIEILWLYDSDVPFFTFFSTPISKALNLHLNFTSGLVFCIKFSEAQSCEEQMS